MKHAISASLCPHTHRNYPPITNNEMRQVPVAGRSGKDPEEEKGNDHGMELLMLLVKSFSMLPMLLQVPLLIVRVL